ncbi:hypothetical protein HNY73_004175 [Argiope bruennichi]|uniref:Uncharacterized protein n=1 Tax=Argiope bruennichi TaxID=94029 RepID=A0A8T0FNF0_ARGBR|nr:hypothetical protein HNY73_004175 [Argiope bruennichi]
MSFFPCISSHGLLKGTSSLTLFFWSVAGKGRRTPQGEKIEDGLKQHGEGGGEENDGSKGRTGETAPPRIKNGLEARAEKKKYDWAGGAGKKKDRVVDGRLGGPVNTRGRAKTRMSQRGKEEHAQEGNGEV